MALKDWKYWKHPERAPVPAPEKYRYAAGRTVEFTGKYDADGAPLYRLPLLGAKSPVFPMYNPRFPRGYRPARVPLGMSPEGAGTFAKWDADRLASKEADAQLKRDAAYSAIAEQEARERGVVLAPPGEPEAVRIPAKIGMMSKIPMGAAAKKAWKFGGAERALRKSGWLKGPTIIRNPRWRMKTRKIKGGWGRRRELRRKYDSYFKKAARKFRLKRLRKFKARRRAPNGRFLSKKRSKKRSRNPLPRWVDRRSIRTIFRGKGKKSRRILVGCPKGSWAPRRKRCKKGMRLVEKKRR